MTYFPHRPNSAGVTGIFPTFTDKGDGMFDVTVCDVYLYDNALFDGEPKKYTVTGLTDQTTARNTTTYLYIDYNSGSPQYVLNTDVSPINESDVVPVVTIYNEGNNELHYLEWDHLGKGLPNKLHARFVKTARFGHESGLALGEYTTTDSAETLNATVDSSNGTLTDGIYDNNAYGYPVITNGSGINATAIVTITGGVPTISIMKIGSGYTIADTFNVAESTDFSTLATGSLTSSVLTVLNTPRVFTITDGVVWFGAVKTFLPAFDSSIEKLAFFYHNIGVVTALDTIVDATTAPTNGTYTFVPVTGGSGTGLTVEVEVSGGTINTIIVDFGGEEYQNTDTGLTINGTDIGGTGGTASFNVTTVDDSGTWRKESDLNQYDNLRYDDGVELQTLSQNDYAVNWIFRDADTPAHVGFMLGSASYTSLAAAVAAPMPPPPPEPISNGILVGRIIAQDGEDIASQIDSAFAITFQGTPVSDHNNLSGLDGGAVGDRFHITAAQETELIDGFPIVFDTYIEKPQNNSEQNVHGGILELATGQPLNNTPTDIVVQQGIGKLYLVARAGTDTAGTVTITGDVVDRDTGAVSADTDSITIAGLSTENTANDANGNVRHDIVDGYMTNKWFTGSVTFSTTDVDLSVVDIYHVSFDQGNDSQSATLETFDINVEALTTSSTTLSAHAYVVENTTGNKFNIQSFSDLEITSVAQAGRYYRLRRGNLDKTFSGLSDGVFIDVFFAGTNGWGSFSMKLWGRMRP